MGGFVFVFPNGWEEAIAMSALSHRHALPGTGAAPDWAAWDHEPFLIVGATEKSTLKVVSPPETEH